MRRAASSLCRRRLVLAAVLLAGFGCGAKAVREPVTATAAEAALLDPPRRPGKPLILVEMPDSAAFRAVRKTFVDEIRKDFDVATVIVDGHTTVAARA